MKHSIKVGVSFGITSGIITTLGLMVGLNASTNSKMVVIGGILMIAIADAVSDALGIHISEESENKHTAKQIWISTFSTFFSKFVFALTFVVPVLLFELQTAVIISVVWGLVWLGYLSLRIAKSQRKSAWRVVTEHITIALIVIAITHFAGKWVSLVFGSV